MLTSTSNRVPGKDTTDAGRLCVERPENERADTAASGTIHGTKLSAAKKKVNLLQATVVEPAKTAEVLGLSALAEALQEVPEETVSRCLEKQKKKFVKKGGQKTVRIEIYRTIVRQIDTSRVSEEDLNEVNGGLDASCMQRRDFAEMLKQKKYRRFCIGNNWQKLRKLLNDSGFESPYGLQTHPWQMALKGAAQLVNRFWCGKQSQILAKMAKSKFFARLSDKEQEYVRHLLADLRTEFFDVLEGKVPDIKKFKGIPFEKRRTICRRIRKVFNQVFGQLPVVRKFCSQDLDERCWRPEEIDGEQFVWLTTRNKGERACLPLKGHGHLKHGDARLVRTDEGLFFHLTVLARVRKLRNVPKAAEGKVYCRAYDQGVTELTMNDHGVSFGVGFGEYISRNAERLSRKHAGRQSVDAVYRKTGSKAKRRKIWKNNKGNKGWNKLTRKCKGALKTFVNTSINQMVRHDPADVWVFEKFGRSFTINKNWPVWVRRLMAMWGRGYTNERFTFKATTNGIRIARVAAAFSSQQCPSCLAFSRHNRNCNYFKCIDCGSRFHADQVGAVNMLRRLHSKKWKKRMSVRNACRAAINEYVERCAERGVTALPEIVNHIKKYE